MDVGVDIQLDGRLSHSSDFVNSSSRSIGSGLTDSIIQFFTGENQTATMPSATASPPHPFDPLISDEITTAISIVRKAHGDSLAFQAVSLLEPRKADMVAWLEDEAKAPRPVRIADVTVIGAEGVVYDGFVDLSTGGIIKWEALDGVQPIVSPRSLPLTTSTEKVLTTLDHTRRTHGRGTYLPHRPPRNRTMRPQRHPRRVHVEDLLRRLDNRL